MMYLGSITLVLSITSVISDETIDTSHIKVFPATNQSIAGVFQVSLLDHLNQPQYAFNASAARSLCSSLGVNIASKAQIQEALKRGLETCRFGWVDENLAVIPRIKALFNCGQNQTGVVAWRAPVIKQFDVFCFNESDAATVSSRDYSGETQSTSKTTISTQTTHTTSSASLHPSSSSAPKTIDWEAEPARFVSTAQGSAGAKVVLITSTCALLLIAIIIIAYLKMQKSCSRSAKLKQKEEDMETGEWASVKSTKETKIDAQEDERIEEDDDAS
ncbi:lymphatic vessel endothelial hyaluronic acid receptor 1a [Anabas testudineus]|uniref:lymphatic vessel endothelial hyaluronic acid receptor 1a n=1 Tax=Anabas testudineus TaxID=64144 RepID=UPI000E45B665|nr:lymphatic vessel endothelial hyaluronic acid receptor 1a [Anabas testudineus]